MSDWVFSKNGARVQTSLQGHIALEDENSYVAAAEAGLGIAQIPAFVLKEAMERGGLELVLGDWFPGAVAAACRVSAASSSLRHGARSSSTGWPELLDSHDGIQLRSTLRL